MSSETIEVKKRERLGSRASAALRQEGFVPANLYGHGEANVNLSLPAGTITNIIHQGTKLLSLTGDITDTALLREVQWDAFGVDVLHVDLTRVSRSERVEVTLPVELHGEAPGTNEGGQLSFVGHELTIECPASNLPEQLDVNISKLHVGDAIHAGDVELPQGAILITPEADVVVQIVKAMVEEDEEGEGGAEPELIRKEKTEENEEG